MGVLLFAAACSSAENPAVGRDGAGAATPGESVAGEVASPVPDPGGSPPSNGAATPPAAAAGDSTPPTAAGPSATTSGGEGVFIQDEEEGLISGAPPPPMQGELVDTVCNSADVEFENVIPTVMILVDRSGSMFNSELENGGTDQQYAGYYDRWTALQEAVLGLEEFQDEVAFGLMTFTGEAGGTCPLIQEAAGAVEVGNFDAIMAMLPDSAEAILKGAKGETPTAESIAIALDALRAVENDGPKNLLIITDGDPELCDAINSGGCGRDPAIAYLQEAYAEGIASYVIGISEDVGVDFLNDLAHAGSGTPVPPPLDWLHCIQQEAERRGDTFDWNEWRPSALAEYGEDDSTYAGQLFYQPEGEALADDLRRIIAGVRSCSFEMADGVNRGQADLGAVRLYNADGSYTDVPYATGDGWILDPELDYIVTMQGAACDAVLDKNVVQSVRIEFPCEVRIPKVK